MVLNFKNSNLDLSLWEQLLRYQVNSMSKGLIETAAAADSPEWKWENFQQRVFHEQAPKPHLHDFPNMQ